MFQVGMKVVCVDGTFPPADERSGMHLPVAERVYTIRYIEETEEGFGVRLAEIFNLPVKIIGPGFGEEPVFRADRFMPYRPAKLFGARR